MNKEASIGADFDITDITVRSRSAPIGADFDTTVSLITVRMKRHQLVPILMTLSLMITEGIGTN